MDPEIAYIHLRDAVPRGAEALMHPAAMTIPANREADGTLRPERTGPVFSVDAHSGNLHMRFTARQRNIVWRDDADTREAVAFLVELLNSDDPSVLRHKLLPGQGVICNNVLHSRSAFTNPSGEASGRLHFRARFSHRIAGT